MDINIHLKVINLNEEIPEVARSDAHGDDISKGTLSSLKTSSSSFFENLLLDTLTKCAVYDFAKGKKTRPHSHPSYNEDIRDLTSSILRYVKIHDRYVAFCSLLLKSFLHHSFLAHQSFSSIDCHPGEDNDQGEIVVRKKRIHVLPRTIEGKPYILIENEEENEDNTTTVAEGATSFPFSISHQFPFVGAIYLDSSNNDVYQLRKMSNVCPMMGLDIVTFNAYEDTQHLYSSEEEFLDVFKDCFTAKEWMHIQSAACNSTTTSRDYRIKEFLLRWSIKEAYTKAIGTGMMTRFHSFESSLYVADTKGGDEVILLSDRVLNERSGSHFVATIRPKRSRQGQKMLEQQVLHWNITFVPLFTAEDEARDEPSACACICAPTIMSGETTLSKDHYRINISSCTLMDLIRFHNPNDD